MSDKTCYAVQGRGATDCRNCSTCNFDAVLAHQNAFREQVMTDIRKKKEAAVGGALQLQTSEILLPPGVSVNEESSADVSTEDDMGILLPGDFGLYTEQRRKADKQPATPPKAHGCGEILYPTGMNG